MRGHAVVTPLGTFSPAPHFEDVTYLQASNGAFGYASQDIWLARGPGVILTVEQGQPAAYFVRGFVNGKTWGSATSGPTTVAGGVSLNARLEGLLRSPRNILLNPR